MGSNHRILTAKQAFLVTVIIALNFTALVAQPILSSSSSSGQYLFDTEASRRLNNNTARIDPLDNLRKYRGGYNLLNIHYWSSTAFTGIPGFAIAALWLLCGIGYLVYLLVTNTCCKRIRKINKRKHCLKQWCNLHHLLLAIILTLLVIMACGLVLGGNVKFNSQVKTVIDIIIDTVDEASTIIYNTTKAMTDIESNLREIGATSEATDFLSSTSETLGPMAAELKRQAFMSRRIANKGLKIMYIVVTVTISLTLTSAMSLLATGFTKFKKTLKAMLVPCWILTVICWLFFGVYFVLQNFAGDACIALESFHKNPYNNSLSTILPCEKLLPAKPVLVDVSSGIYNLVHQVNKNLSSSIGNFVQICNPFSPAPLYEYQPMNCPSTAIPIGDIPTVVRSIICPESEVVTTCVGGIIVPDIYYNTVKAYSRSLQSLLDVYPGTKGLVECETINDAFSEILQKHCGPLTRNIRMVWGSLIFLSVVMVALVLVWSIGEHNKQHCYSNSSVKPDPNAVENLESGVKTTGDDSKPV